MCQQWLIKYNKGLMPMQQVNNGEKRDDKGYFLLNFSFNHLKKMVLILKSNDLHTRKETRD